MAETQAVKRVAVVLFDGFTVLDVYGPVQAFGASRIVRPDGTPHRFFKIFTVADHAGPIKSGEGPSTHADHTFYIKTRTVFGVLKNYNFAPFGRT